MRLSLLCLTAFVATTQAFAPVMHSSCSVAFATTASPSSMPALHLQQNDESSQDEEESVLSAQPNMAKLATGAITAWTMTSQMASAAGPDWGIFEGRTLSLLHPVMMLSLLAFSVYTGILGFNWRRQRTLGDVISGLKKQLPDLEGAASVSAALTAAKEADMVDSARVNTLTAAVSIATEIADLTAERKQLASEGPRDKHYMQGTLLAFFGTAFAIEGPLNTYARAGKLFPGPHLYAGASLVVLWSLAAAMVPSMQKGNDTARSIHIGANAVGIGLFGWQVVSGIPILLKVIEKTSWP